MGTVFRSPSTSRLALLPLGILISLSLFSQTAQATCYFPDGSTADSGHKECSPNSSNATTCCADGFQCLSNGLCNDQRYENWGRLLRGACTEKAFGGNCTDVCRDSTFYQVNTQHNTNNAQYGHKAMRSCGTADRAIIAVLGTMTAATITALKRRI